MSSEVSERREADRKHVFLQESMTLGDDPVAVRVRLRNVSTTGMMAETELPVVRGESVTISLRRSTPVQGTIVWVDGSRFAIKFDDAIDAAIEPEHKITIARSPFANVCFRRPGTQPQAVSADALQYGSRWHNGDLGGRLGR